MAKWVYDYVEPTMVFWERIFAFAIDLLILQVFGLVLFYLFPEQIYALDYSGALVGFLIFTLYFGYMNSYKFLGQTIGKKIMKIKTVDSRGYFIPVAKSFQRAAILAPVTLVPQLIADYPFFAIAFIFFISLGIPLAAFLAYLFNFSNRQSIHDLIVGTYVIRTCYKDENIKLKPANSFVYVIIVVSLFFSLTYAVNKANIYYACINCDETGVLKNNSNLNVEVALNEFPNTFFHSYKPPIGKKYTYVIIKKNDDALVNEGYFNKTAKEILELCPLDESSYLGIFFVKQYDIGIRKARSMQYQVQSVSSWDFRINPPYKDYN